MSGYKQAGPLPGAHGRLHPEAEGLPFWLNSVYDPPTDTIRKIIKSGVEGFCSHDWPDDTPLPESCPECDKIIDEIIPDLTAHFSEQVRAAERLAVRLALGKVLFILENELDGLWTGNETDVPEVHFSEVAFTAALDHIRALNPATLGGWK